MSHYGRRIYDTPNQAHVDRRFNRKSEPNHRVQLVSHCKNCKGWFLTAAPTTLREVMRLAGGTA
jgi:hypothetical protein